MQQLSARQIASIKKPGRYRVNDNLSVKAQKTNGKLYAKFVLRYQVQGEVVERSLGSTTKITLKEARSKAEALMTGMVNDQVTPAEQLQKEKKKAKASQKKAANAGVTFSELAAEYIEKIKAPAWKNPARSAQTWTHRLENHAGHIIGNKPVGDITKDDIQNILLPLWLDKNETAMRVRMYIFDILEYAADKDYTINSNPASTRIYKLLPEFTGQVKHWPALHHDLAPKLYAGLLARNNDSATALQMIMLTAQRQIDVRTARWDQIDLDGQVWHAPIAKLTRKKSVYTLDVPLQDQLCKLLADKKTGFNNYSVMPDFVFPSGGAKGHISDVAVRKELHRFRLLDDDGVLVSLHGMRTTFKDWHRVVEGVREFDDELSEIQLSHVSRSDVRSAYARDVLLPRRAKLMQTYANFLCAA
jgi:integrase